MCEVGQVTTQEELEALFLAVDRGSVHAADLVVLATYGLARFLVGGVLVERRERVLVKVGEVTREHQGVGEFFL